MTPPRQTGATGRGSGITGGRLRGGLSRGVDLALRVIPFGAIVAIGAYIAAQQAVSPNRRVVKLSVLLGLLVLMFRFDMVWSVYLFTLLFPFPSGISIGSTNSVLMTLIPLIWAVRAASTKTTLLRPTKLDAPIMVFLMAYLVSFINVDQGYQLVEGVKILWRQLACFGYFYMIVMFVNDEEKLMRMIKVVCAMTAFVMLTAVWELAFPGKTIIPGWIGVSQLRGEGTLRFRVEGIRVGGALHSHAMLSDLASNVFFLMAFLAYRVRNPLEKTIWIVCCGLTIVGMLSTGNRGAFVGFTVGSFWALYLLRRQIPPLRTVMIVVVGASLLIVTDQILSQKTFSTSVIDRLMHSEFEGVVPENRTMTWRPALEKSFDHIFVGHGPFYETGRGLSFQYWPHNGYIFYLYTLGMFGLGVFLWILARVAGITRMHRFKGVDGTDLGTIMKLLQVWLLISCVGQLRTDHQRDDVYVFIIWLMFGLIIATGQIIGQNLSHSRASTGDARPNARE